MVLQRLRLLGRARGEDQDHAARLRSRKRRDDPAFQGRHVGRPPALAMPPPGQDNALLLFPAAGDVTQSGSPGANAYRATLDRGPRGAAEIHVVRRALGSTRRESDLHGPTRPDLELMRASELFNKGPAQPLA